METEETGIVELPRKKTVRMVSADRADLPLTYVNAISIEASYMDFHFILANQFSGNNDEVLVKELHRIVMSPQHAKAVLSMLSKQIKKYEDKFGNILTPGEESNV